MYMYIICVYVYVYNICICICMYVCMYVCMCIIERKSLRIVSTIKPAKILSGILSGSFNGQLKVLGAF